MKDRRLILVLADGLRPDAIIAARMPSLYGLAQAFTAATDARTIRPSATVAVTVPVTWALAAAAGARRLLPAGRRARDTAAAADWLVTEPGAGLVFVYLPDCDRAGHEQGWMSAAYLEAASEVDAAIGRLSAQVEEALLVVVADHGGGGVIATEHHHPHPVNERIPLILAGPGVARGHRLDGPVSLLDVSATVLWWFGTPVPESYESRPLLEAFAPTLVPEAVG